MIPDLPSSPAALRNREPIAEVLRDVLPDEGLVLEIASGTGEHAAFFAAQFPRLGWQPSDGDAETLGWIEARRISSGQSNILAPLQLDASSDCWPVAAAEAALCVKTPSDSRQGSGTTEKGVFSAVLCINMVHISPWSAALGLIDGAARVLRTGGALILYGPWLQADTPTAPSNLAFDQQLRRRDPEWGLRTVEDFEAEALKRGFVLEQVRPMPANNLMLLFRLAGQRRSAASV